MENPRPRKPTLHAALAARLGCKRLSGTGWGGGCRLMQNHLFGPPDGRWGDGGWERPVKRAGVGAWTQTGMPQAGEGISGHSKWVF